MRFNRKGQTDLIGNVLSIIPKPVLFILFIAFLGVIGYLLSPVFNAFGVYCDSSGEVLKIPNGDIFSNLAINSKLKQSVEPDKTVLYVFKTKCTTAYEGEIRFLDYGCTTCSHIPFDEVYDGIIDGLNSPEVCVGDAYRTPDENMTWFQRTLKCNVDDCAIPKGYYYESDTDSFECFDNLCEVSESVYRDNVLADFGGVPFYSSDNDGKSYDSVFRYGCSSGLRVEPTVAGIPILNPKFWALFTLVILMIWAIIHFRKK